MPALAPDLKYRLYEESVQDTGTDIDFINAEFRRLAGRAPLTLREDFGGTGLLSCGWVRQSPRHLAWAVDLDAEPQAHGRRAHLAKIPPDARRRVTYVLGDVRDGLGPKADVISAFNFSYFVFKKRRDLVGYFRTVRAGLGDGGVFFLDIFGGTDCFQALEETTEFARHDYMWDCADYNPLTHETTYHIHFKDKGGKDGKGRKGTSHRRVFSYDWRHWTVMEVVEALEDAGFGRVRTYWEGDGEDGEGDCEFTETRRGEPCASWICYISGQA